MKKATLLLLPILVICTISASLLGQIYSLSGTLSGANEVPPNASTAMGTISGTYNQATGMIAFDIDFSGLTTNVTVAHLHDAPAGVNGGAIINLFPPIVTSGNIVGNFALPMANEPAFLAGNTYVNIHTSTYPGGEIRAQVIAQQVPPVPTLQTWGIIILFLTLTILGIFVLKFNSLTSPIIVKKL